MQKYLSLPTKTIPYTLRRSSRARRMRLAVYGDGTVVLTSPIDMAERFAENFIREKAFWLVSKLELFRRRRERRASQGASSLPRLPRTTRADYIKNKASARALVEQKLTHFNEIYQYEYRKASIRNQKTCWGSCSRKGNLNFNWKLLLLPEHMQDYIVIHELCHLAEFNHSPRFWSLVARTVPDYALIRKALRGML